MCNSCPVDEGEEGSAGEWPLPSGVAGLSSHASLLDALTARSAYGDTCQPASW